MKNSLNMYRAVEYPFCLVCIESDKLIFSSTPGQALYLSLDCNIEGLTVHEMAELCLHHLKVET
jgi:hypothetical protein